MQPLNKIFHPTDLSTASEVAFRHALKLAVTTHAELTIMHVSREAGVHRDTLPGVRTVLAQWGLIPPDSDKSALNTLGLKVRKVLSKHTDPARACRHYLDDHATDLLVLAIHQHGTGSRWLHHAVGGPIVRNSGSMALFIPHGVEGFVSPADGCLNLRNILIPVASKPRAQIAVDTVQRLAVLLGLTEVRVTLLHVGPAGDAPELNLPAGTGLHWQRANRAGDVVDGIVQTASEGSHTLVVMPSEGRHGLFDALQGSTTEQVLRHIHCPVLSVPV